MLRLPLKGLVVSGVILPETGASFPAANHIRQPVFSLLHFSSDAGPHREGPGTRFASLCSALFHSILLALKGRLSHLSPTACNNSTFSRRDDVTAGKSTLRIRSSIEGRSIGRAFDRGMLAAMG